MKKFLIFMLGMLFGIIFVFAALAGGIYIALTVVKPSDISPDTTTYLGDFADMSILDMAKSLSDLYKEKIGVAEGDRYFSVGEFLDKYHIDTKTAFGLELPQDVLDVPAFEFFNSQDGVNNAMKQIKVSALPSIANMFGSSDNGASFSDDVIAELSKHSLFDLLQDESKGISVVFENIKIADVASSMFPPEDSDNKLMWAVGQTSIGKLLAGVSGEKNILAQVNEGGAFEALGKQQIIAIAGDNDMIKAIVGELTIADLVDGDGNLNLDKVTEGISLGEMLGLTRTEVTETDGYTTLIYGTEGENAEQVSLVMYKDADAIREYVKRANGKYYQAELDCKEEDASHVHTTECFRTIWYDVNGNKSNGVYSVIANLTVAELTSGDQDALMKKLYDVPIADFIDESNSNAIMKAIAHMTVGELMGGGLDEMYLGSFFGYQQNKIDVNDIDKNSVVHLALNETNPDLLTLYVTAKAGDSSYTVLSDDNKNWYEGELTCNESHTHYADCYRYVWYLNAATGTKPDQGVQLALADRKIGYLNGLNNYVLELTLGEVLGDSIPSMLSSLKDTAIKDLETAINDMYLGELLGYEQIGGKWYDNGIELTGAVAKIVSKKVGELDTLSSVIEELTLREVLNDIPAVLESVADTKIGELGSAIDGMYLGEFLKYKFENGVWTDENGQEVTGVLSHIVGITVSELNGTTLTNAINGMTLGEVLGESDNAILKELSDVKISELSSKLNDIYLGSAMGYNRKETADLESYVNTVLTDVKADNANNYVRFDGKTWYEAELTCNETHAHTVECYGYIWYDQSDKPADGVTKAFVNNKISDDIAGTVNNLTLRKLGIKGNTILNQLQDTKITEIGDAISDMKLGTVMGYIKSDDGKWYTHNCGITDENHEHGDECYTKEVTGLNAKMSNMTMANFSNGDGLTNIVATLTVKELIDSGMLSLGDTDAKAEENSYKFAIIYCGQDDETEDHNCTLQGYALAHQLGTSAKDYWLKCHGVTDESALSTDQIRHRDYWQGQQLSSFIQTLLDAI